MVGAPSRTIHPTAPLSSVSYPPCRMCRTVLPFFSSGGSAGCGCGHGHVDRIRGALLLAAEQRGRDGEAAHGAATCHRQGARMLSTITLCPRFNPPGSKLLQRSLSTVMRSFSGSFPSAARPSRPRRRSRSCSCRTSAASPPASFEYLRSATTHYACKRPAGTHQSRPPCTTQTGRGASDASGTQFCTRSFSV